MRTFRARFCWGFGFGRFYLYPSELLHWHWGDHRIAPMPVAQPWRIWINSSWWRHKMETFFALLALCEENPRFTSWFPVERPVVRSFDVSFDLCLDKRLSKQTRRRLFEKPSCSLWRHCNGKSHIPTTDCNITITKQSAAKHTYFIKYTVSDFPSLDNQSRHFLDMPHLTLHDKSNR